MSEYRFEEEGTQEWLCAKTQAPELHPKHLYYRVKLSRDATLSVRIVDPTRRTWYGRKGKTLVRARNWLDQDNDWRDQIQQLAEIAFDRLEIDRSIHAARHGENPYFGDFHRG